MKKKKNVNKKRVALIIIPIVLLVIIIMFATIINNKNDKNGVFSLLEKRWIEKNKTRIVDVSIINDVPIFGEDGDGVFFDFLNDFTNETNIQFNMIPYKNSGEASSNYAFEMTNNTALNEVYI